MKKDVKVTSVTLPIDVYSSLTEEAKQKGLPMPTYCRMLLCELVRLKRVA